MEVESLEGRWKAAFLFYNLNILACKLGRGVFQKSKGDAAAYWEFTVLIGHDSKDVGFLVKIDPIHWEELTGGRVSPEHLIKKSFQFLLKKHRGVKYAIWRDFDLRQIQRSFPEYRDEMRKAARRTIGFGMFSS